jgi:hypothetical protein
VLNSDSSKKQRSEVPTLAKNARVGHPHSWWFLRDGATGPAKPQSYSQLAMTRTREEILHQRRQLREKYRSLYDATIALLFLHDPVGINFDDNTDEYEPEAGTILPKLQSCRSADYALQVVYGEFLRWFGDSAGSKENYERIANQLWEKYRRDVTDTA